MNYLKIISLFLKFLFVAWLQLSATAFANPFKRVGLCSHILAQTLERFGTTLSQPLLSRIQERPAPLIKRATSSAKQILSLNSPRKDQILEYYKAETFTEVQILQAVHSGQVQHTLNEIWNYHPDRKKRNQEALEFLEYGIMSEEFPIERLWIVYEPSKQLQPSIAQKLADLDPREPVIGYFSEIFPLIDKDLKKSISFVAYDFDGTGMTQIGALPTEIRVTGVLNSSLESLLERIIEGGLEHRLVFESDLIHVINEGDMVALDSLGSDPPQAFVTLLKDWCRRHIKEVSQQNPKHFLVTLKNGKEISLEFE